MSRTTEPTSYVPMPIRFDFDAHAPATAKAVADLHQAAIDDLINAGIDPQLIELVRLRASQINGCAYCVDSHARDARKTGVSAQRVDAAGNHFLRASEPVGVRGRVSHQAARPPRRRST